MKKIIHFLCAVLLVSAIIPVQCFANTAIKTGWLGELEALACWSAHQNKMDKTLIFDMQRYPTGKLLADSYTQWDIASCGLIPAFDAILKKEAVIIGLGVDETIGNMLFVKNDSAILSAKNSNPDFPNVYGSADSVRGKTILCAFNSNAHMLVLTWLNILGLSDQDVRLIDVKPEEAFSAFQKGMGDIIALWAPDSYLALKNNLVPVAKAEDCKLNFLTVILANKNYLEKNPENVKEFLSVYYTSAEKLMHMNSSELANLYSTFLWNFANINLSEDDAQNIIQHQVILTQEPFNALAEKDKNSLLYKIISDSAVYYSNINALSRHEKEFLLELSYIKNLL